MNNENDIADKNFNTISYFFVMQTYFVANSQ